MTSTRVRLDSRAQSGLDLLAAESGIREGHEQRAASRDLLDRGHEASRKLTVTRDDRDRTALHLHYSTSSCRYCLIADAFCMRFIKRSLNASARIDAASTAADDSSRSLRPRR